jgi:hypothetical protein
MGFLVRTLLLLLLLTPDVVLAATYYVRTDGNNSNTGLADEAGSAWLTIQYAANTVSSGDTVYVQAGTYPEKVTVQNSGTSGAHITYTADGEVTLGGFLVSGAYVDVSGFNLDGTNVGTYQGCIHVNKGSNYCKFDDMSVTGKGDTIAVGFGGVYTYGEHCTFNKITVTNPNYHSFTIVGNGTTVTNCTVNDVNGWDVFRIIASDVRVAGCTITASNLHANPNHGDMFQSFNVNGGVSQNVVIEGNRVLGGTHYQIGNFEDQLLNQSVSYWTFQNNIFIGVTNALNLFTDHFSFYNNTFYRCGATSNWVIIWNGSDTKGYATNTRVMNNLFVECGTASLATKGWYGGITQAGLVTDYNLVVGTGAGTTKTGFNEPHGLNGVDPLFVDPANGIYSLQASSPAKETGVLIEGFSADILGVARPQGALWDIGAYEYRTVPNISNFGTGAITMTPNNSGAIAVTPY